MNRAGTLSPASPGLALLRSGTAFRPTQPTHSRRRGTSETRQAVTARGAARTMRSSDRPVAVGPVARPDFPPQYFTVGVLGKVRDELHGSRPLGRRQLVAAPGE